MADFVSELKSLIASGASDAAIAAHARGPLVQQPAPGFTSIALMPNKEFKQVSLSDYLGKYVVLFFYPLDFTFVCPTEIIAFGDRQAEFDAINTQVLACSCDSHFSHLAWVNTSRSEGGLGEMKIPIIADFNKTVASSYGVLVNKGPDTGIPLRGLFIISPTGVLRQSTINDLPVGRNVDEAIRLIKAFQFNEKYGEVCPANWQPGSKTMAADTNQSKTYFNEVFKVGGRVEEVSSKDKLSELISAPNVTVIDFWAPWCRNCVKISPAIELLAAELDSVKFVKVDAQANDSIAADYNVDVLPTFLIFKAGKKVAEIIGSDVTKIGSAIRAAI
jgi:peroxiredoxin (alkyl hydroperoxide reductase subunit C)